MAPPTGQSRNDRQGSIAGVLPRKGPHLDTITAWGVGVPNHPRKGGYVNSADEVERLFAELQNPAFRKSFYLDADAAMETAGLNANQIPAELMNTLKGLSHLELGVIARVNRELGPLKGDEAMLMGPL